MRDKLTVKEAAAYLGTTRQKIHRLLKRGVLQAETNPLDNRYKLIKKSDLDAVKAYSEYLNDDDEETEPAKVVTLPPVAVLVAPVEPKEVEAVETTSEPEKTAIKPVEQAKAA